MLLFNAQVTLSFSFLCFRELKQLLYFIFCGAFKILKYNL